MNTGTESMRFLCVFAFELGRLKRLPRTGWGDAGVPGPVESVAEHSHRTSLLAFMIAAEEGADPDRAAALGAWHDVPEVWTGDTSHARIPYVRTVDPALVIADQTETLPASLAERARAAVVEFERGGSRPKPWWRGMRTGWSVCCRRGSINGWARRTWVIGSSRRWRAYGRRPRWLLRVRRWRPNRVRGGAGSDAGSSRPRFPVGPVCWGFRARGLRVRSGVVVGHGLEFLASGRIRGRRLLRWPRSMNGPARVSSWWG